MHDTASAGHKDVVELLVAKGADVGAKGKQGNTPSHSAVSGAMGREFMIDVGQLNSHRL